MQLKFELNLFQFANTYLYFTRMRLQISVYNSHKFKFCVLAYALYTLLCERCQKFNLIL